MISTDHLRPLPPGARIALLGTAGPPAAAALDAHVGLVRSWGFEPVVMASARAEHPRAAYLTGPDELRAGDLTAAWCDPDIAAIMCVRGGYGTTRMLDLLDLDAMGRATPKPVLGSSDVTALLELLAERLSVASWFTPMLASVAIAADAGAVAGIHRVLTEPWQGTSIAPSRAITLVPGRATGRIVGGNQCLLASTIGARGRPPLDHAGTIVVLEDVGEELYRMDRDLRQLIRSGWFDGVAGIALGSWAQCDDETAVEQLIIDDLGGLGVPIVSRLGFGHGPAAPSVPIGVPGELVADDRPRLSFGPDRS